MKQIKSECEAIMFKTTKLAESETASKLIQTYTDKLKNTYGRKEEEIKAKNAKLSEE